MAIVYDANTGQLTSGVYQGQTRPVALGDVYAMAKNRRGRGTNYVGFVAGPEYVRLQAFYDAEPLLASRAGTVGYVQFGRLLFNGVAVPTDHHQAFFPARRPQRSTGLSGSPIASLSQWWVDTELGITHPFAPARAFATNPALKPEQLFVYPSSAGNFVRATTEVRKPNEALAASLICTVDCSTLPSTQPSDPVQSALDDLRESMELEADEPLLSVKIDGLRGLFNFFGAVKSTIANHGPIADDFTIQYLPFNKSPILLVRGTYRGKEHGYFEITYPLLVPGNNTLQFWKCDFTALGWSDQVKYLMITKGQAKLKLVEIDLAPTFVPTLQLFSVLKQKFDAQNLILDEAFELQVVGDAVLLRGTFVKQERKKADKEDRNKDPETVYYGSLNADDPDQIDFYPFDVNTYIDLDQSSDDEPADPLGIYLFRSIDDPVKVPSLGDYGLPAFESFLSQQNVLIEELDTNPRTIEYQFKTMVGLIDDDAKKVLLFDGFSWNLSRTLIAGDDDWSPVAFDIRCLKPARASDYVLSTRLLVEHFRNVARVDGWSVRWSR